MKKKVTLDSLSVDIKGLSSGLKALSSKVGDLDNKIVNLDTRVGNLETNVAVLNTKTSDLDTKMVSMASSLEDLARMVADGFSQTTTKQELWEVRDEMKGEITGLKVGQERIELRLQQAAWQGDYRELNERVTKIERTGNSSTRYSKQ